MMKIRAIIVAITSVIILTIPASAFAYSALQGADCVNGKDSAICNRSNSDPLTGNDGILIHITNIVAFVAGAAAVIIIVVSGIRYITAGGDSNAVGAAKNTLIGAIIGLVVIVLAKVLITFVVNQL